MWWGGSDLVPPLEREELVARGASVENILAFWGMGALPLFLLFPPFFCFLFLAKGRGRSLPPFYSVSSLHT